MGNISSLLVVRSEAEIEICAAPDLVQPEARSPFCFTQSSELASDKPY
jgi:hypothetical protein